MRSYHLSLRDAIADTTDDTARPPLAGHSDTFDEWPPARYWDESPAALLELDYDPEPEPICED